MANSRYPNLSFPGTAREGMEFYQRVLDGDLRIQTDEESPEAGDAQPGMEGKVRHAHLQFDGGVILASDVPPQQIGRPVAMLQLHLEISPVERAEKIFASLSEGGHVHMPWEETSWTHRFGMLTDKYGFSWMISSAKPNGI